MGYESGAGYTIKDIIRVQENGCCRNHGNNDPETGSLFHPSRSFISPLKSCMNFQSCGFFGGVRMSAFATSSGVASSGSGIVYLTGRPRLRFDSDLSLLISDSSLSVP